jgi:soluble lytic murein transglycosylase
MHAVFRFAYCVSGQGGRGRLAAAAASTLFAAFAHAAPPTDAEFLAAKGYFERGDRANLAIAAAPFAGNLLEPYTAYWKLKLGLNDVVTRADVRAYLDRWPDTPLADRLRVEWLKVLGRRADWATFGLDYVQAPSEDNELACYGIQYRRLRDGEAALAAAKPLWLTGSATPDACEPLFAALIKRDEITVADRRARFRLAVEAGNVKLAQAIAGELPPEDRITAREFAHVDRDPARALAKGEFAWKHRGGRELALYALERAARSDPQGVRSAWEQQRSHVTDAERRYGNGRIAFYAARQLAPQANDWFREADGAVLNEAQHTWRVRAALRAGSWPSVLTAVDAMPPALAQESPWRYWKARALAAAGRVDDANALYAALAQETHFYGVLAAEAIGKPLPDGRPVIAANAASLAAAPATSAPVTTAPAPLAPPSAAALAAFGAKPGVARAVKLTELSLKPEALREWIYAIRGLDDDALLVAAEYARQKKLYDRAINTAERTAARHDFALRYLAPYREYFTAAAREQGIDVAIILGIARQESRFSTDIVSSAGAVGLMQLMPGTAKWVAKQLGRNDFRASDIGDVTLNTQFGAFYFKYWQDRLDRQPALAAAAYNAGPSRAQAWRVGTPLEGAIWVETIPFNETRDYVKKVLANVMFYTRELNLPPKSLTARLGTIMPRGEGGNADVTAKAE